MELIKILVCLLLLASVTSKMVYMAEMFRHGARYPTGDIWDGKETKPFHGLLTGVGMRQHYLLGTYLNKDYLSQLGMSPYFNSK